MSLLFTLCSFTYSQTAYEESKILDNTSISVVGGVTTPLDFNSVFPVNGVAGIIGSASPEGSSKYNQKLSEKRAEVVSKFLTGNGVIVENCIGTGVTDTTSGRVAIVTIK